jgi:hypothetical protein
LAVTLLLKDTEGAPAPDAPDQTAEPAPEAVPRACATCGAEMAPDQDWCLSCGQAAPGRLGGRPGMRAAATVAALTLALAGGAVAASYAALRNGDDRPATSVAQAPPAADVPPVTTPPAATPPPVATPPATPPAATPKTPKTTTPPATSTPPVPSSPSGSASTPPASNPTPPASTPAKKPAPAPAPTGPEPIDLGADAVAAYDPYSRVTAQGDPVDAYDGDPGTSWKVTVPADNGQMAVGLAVDLGAKRSVDVAELTTRTPGFGVEVYATDAKELPPDVLDTRWAHLRNATVGVKKGDKASISLGTGKSKYRYVLMWFTKPPEDGATVRISELSLLG